MAVARRVIGVPTADRTFGLLQQADHKLRNASKCNNLVERFSASFALVQRVRDACRVT
jgi:hypothetical protein